MSNKIDWVVHCCVNGIVCEERGGMENGYMPGTCNCHTHGMERYQHPDFQIILEYPLEEIGRILNTMGYRVQAGERFNDGDMVSDIYEDCDVRLSAFEETGRMVLRVVIPDKHNRFPEDSECEQPYSLQMFTTAFIYKQGGWMQ